MVLLRSRVGYLMAIVGVIAINLAAARAYISGSEHFGWDLYSVLEVVPIGVALQVAILQLVRSPGRGRIFWVGFVACGIVSMATLIWARFDPPYETTTFSYCRPGYQDVLSRMSRGTPLGGVHGSRLRGARTDQLSLWWWNGRIRRQRYNCCPYSVAADTPRLGYGGTGLIDWQAKVWGKWSLWGKSRKVQTIACKGDIAEWH